MLLRQSFITLFIALTLIIMAIWLWFFVTEYASGELSGARVAAEDDGPFAGRSARQQWDFQFGALRFFCAACFQHDFDANAFRR